jgi:hypothetical protein
MASQIEVQVAPATARDGIDTRNKDLIVACNETQEWACSECGAEVDECHRCVECAGAAAQAWMEEMDFEAQAAAERDALEFVDPGYQEDDFLAEEEEEEDDWDVEGWESDGPPAPVVTSTRRLVAAALGPAGRERAVATAQESAPWYGPRSRTNALEFDLIAAVLSPARVDRSIQKFGYNPATEEDQSAW